MEARAILTAFSTASAPVVKKAVFFGVGPGTSAFSFSASSTKLSYGVTIAQVWVKRSIWPFTASITFG